MSEASTAQPAKSRWRRLCGFFPIPFFTSPETKFIVAASPSPQQYGTLVSVSQVANNQGYTRLPEENATGKPSASKKSKGPDATMTENVGSSTGSSSAAVKRSKSRDRVAFTPPSVSNLESLKSAQKRARQFGAGSLSEGEAPRSVPGLPKTAPVTPKQARTKASAGDSVASPHAASRQQVNNSRPEAIVYEATVENGLTQPSSRPPAATLTSTSTVWNSPVAIHPNTASGAPVWDSDSERLVSATSRPESSRSKSATTTTPAAQRSILQRPNGTPVGQVPSGNNVSKTFSQAQTEQDRSSVITKYVEALTAARTDPVAYLESHDLFNSQKNRKAKKLQYDDSTSTPKKYVVQVKVDGKLVASSAAAGQDAKLAKARAAFKAIDALSVGSFLSMICITFTR